MARRRWQIDLRPDEERVLASARKAFGADGDSETGRALLALYTRVAAAVGSGAVVSFLPGDDPNAVDAFPELTRALRPDRAYRWLVATPHPWRRQLSFKGRRLTVGQFVDAVEANGFTAEAAAAELDLPIEAVYEALDYASRQRELIDAEAREERRQAAGAVTRHAPAAR